MWGNCDDGDDALSDAIVPENSESGGRFILDIRLENFFAIFTFDRIVFMCI